MYVNKNNKWKPSNDGDWTFFTAVIKTLNKLAKFDSIKVDEHGMAWITYSSGLSYAVEIEILPDGTFQQSVANEKEIKRGGKE